MAGGMLYVAGFGGGVTSFDGIMRRQRVAVTGAPAKSAPWCRTHAPAGGQHGAEAVRRGRVAARKAQHHDAPGLAHTAHRHGRRHGPHRRGHADRQRHRRRVPGRAAAKIVREGRVSGVQVVHHQGDAPPNAAEPSGLAGHVERVDAHTPAFGRFGPRHTLKIDTGNVIDKASWKRGDCIRYVLSIWGEAKAQTPPGIRIGALLALSGPSAYLGDPVQKSLVLLLDQYNKQGGLAGHKLTVIGGIYLPSQGIWVIGALVVVNAALYWLFRRASLGMAMRAAAGNARAAQLYGIDPRLMSTLSYNAVVVSTMARSARRVAAPIDPLASRSIAIK